MREAQDELLTITQIAKLENEPPHRVGYAIERYQIQPAQRVGIIRVFTRDQLPAIRAALRRTASAAVGGRCTS